MGEVYAVAPQAAIARRKVRELSGLVGGFPYAGPPEGRIATDLTKTAQQVKQGEVDEPAVAAVVRLQGDRFGIPAVQAVRSCKGWVAWRKGNAPISAVLMGRRRRNRGAFRLEY